MLAAIPDGAEVHIALSETIRELGITDEIDTSGRYDSIRARLGAMDRETQDREMRKLGAAPDYIIGSAHAVTEDGQVVVGSGSGLRTPSKDEPTPGGESAWSTGDPAGAVAVLSRLLHLGRKMGRMPHDRAHACP